MTGLSTNEDVVSLVKAVAPKPVNVWLWGRDFPWPSTRTWASEELQHRKYERTIGKEKIEWPATEIVCELAEKARQIAESRQH